jgi:chaperonin GroEL (HSP60 family)
MVPGGGAVEMAISRELEKEKDKMKSMASYGVECVCAALKRPLAQIVYNAGFNPLEKMEEVNFTQSEKNSFSIGINCETGEVADMVELGVLDPALVKLHAIKAAGEVTEAILRIDTIIKKKDESVPSKPGAETPNGMAEMDF